jgi:hypothetical protein
LNVRTADDEFNRLVTSEDLISSNPEVVPLESKSKSEGVFI